MTSFVAPAICELVRQQDLETCAIVALVVFVLGLYMGAVLVGRRYQ